jgi:hypothetical protein
VVHEPVDHRDYCGLDAEDFAPGGEGLAEVTISEALS